MEHFSKSVIDYSSNEFITKWVVYLDSKVIFKFFLLALGTALSFVTDSSIWRLTTRPNISLDITSLTCLLCAGFRKYFSGKTKFQPTTATGVLPGFFLNLHQPYLVLLSSFGEHGILTTSEHTSYAWFELRIGHWELDIHVRHGLCCSWNNKI